MQKTEDFMELASERYMEHIKDLDRQINVSLLHVAQAKSKLDIAGVSYNPHVASALFSDSSIPHKLYILEEALNEAETELQGYKEEMQDAKQALKAIENVTYRSILKCRYILNLDWFHTAKVIGYSQSYSKSLKRPALIALYPHIPETWRRNFPKAEI